MTTAITAKEPSAGKPYGETTMDNTTTKGNTTAKYGHVSLFAKYRGIALTVAFCAAAAGGWYCNYCRGHESTDDAVIEGHVLPVSPKVSGQIAGVLVDDNQEVKRGELLAEIDPRDYQVKLDQARAELTAAQADARRAAADARRYGQLFSHDRVSKQAYDNAVADADVLRARAEVARKKTDAAELDLSYTKITARQDGRISGKSAEPGAFVQTGEQLFSIVPSQVWVVADFKETQLEHMRPGEAVAIKVDTYPGHTFAGHVDSIQSGTGSRFSLLPAENATGNFIKVVQRVPVKIVFDEPTSGYRLLPGMSVVPTVRLP
jgi:membrane fusion protein (multidrug efflux system)